MKKYIKPQIEVIAISNTHILCSSYNSECKYICDNDCKIWHTCLDRLNGKRCYDKQSKYGL